MSRFFSPSSKRSRQKYALQKLRLLYFLIATTATIFLVIFLNNSFYRLPALGKFLSPQHGVWQNIEKINQPVNTELEVHNITIQNAKILYDDRNVPHIFANTDDEAFFLQGFLHAKNRLWQMDFYAYLASGRLSEIVGKRGVEMDIFFRKSEFPKMANVLLQQIERDPITKKIADQYTAGVNEYIQNLTYAKYPIEYKLYSYKPEAWSNYKTALLLKLLAFDKMSFNEDIKKTFLIKTFGQKLYKLLYPDISTIDVPTFNSSADFDIVEKMPQHGFLNALKYDSFFSNQNIPFVFEEPYLPQMEINAAAWAVTKNKSKANASMLCNSFSSFFTLPNFAYEMQIKTEYCNVYGVTYPGIPSVIAGFNNYSAWAANTPNVDTKDYFEMTFRTEQKDFYFFNDDWKRTTSTTEHIKVRNGIDIEVKCITTPIGPIVFDKTINGICKGYALKSTVQESSNDLKTYYLLNRMNSYSDFKQAIKHVHSSVSNFFYSDIQGNIALHLEGDIPVRHEYGGDFVYPAIDSSFLWKQQIPDLEKPFLYNPSNDFVFSNNQMLFYPSVYPYYLGTGQNGLSSKRIYDYISGKEKIGIQEMMFLQNENFSSFAETLTPLLLEFVPQENVDTKALKYIKILQNWNYRYDSEEEAPTIFELWINSIQNSLIQDEIVKFSELNHYTIPPIALIQMLQNTDAPNPWVDDIRTPEIETWNQIITEAFKAIQPKLVQLNKSKHLSWSFQHHVALMHPLGMNSMSVKHVNPYGGSDKVFTNFNANYGNTCKMIVQLSSPIEAYISIPGGQSGNPGSPFYKSEIPRWLNGEYAKIIFLNSPKINNSIVRKVVVSNRKSKKNTWNFFNFDL